MAASSIEEALVTKIKATATVTAFIGTGANARIYFLDAPEGDLTFPYIMVSTVSSPNEAQYIGQSGGQPRVQLSIFHTHKQNGLDLANALVVALTHFSGTSDGYNIQYMTTTGPNTLKDPDYDNVYQFIVDVIINYDRS